MARLSSPPPRVGRTPWQVGLAPKADSAPPSARANAPWRKRYKTARWRELRLKVFDRDHYTCRMCGRLEGDTAKLTCDHVRPHRGDERLFWDEGNLQTLCTDPCHVRHKQRLEQDTIHHTGTWD